MSRAALLPPVLLGLVVLLLAQLVGLAASALLGLPVPGVVLGIMLLVVLGVLRPTRAVARAAEPAATPLLAHLQLLFVPPSVGIVLELESLAQNALPLALAVGGSFLVPLIVSGMVLQALLRRQDRRRGGTADGPADGPADGSADGSADGPADGLGDGSPDGSSGGPADGPGDGSGDESGPGPVPQLGGSPA
ncbi:CidA/LrgA family protein [Brachybacterium sp.]|uniref:CidA/LrgA family protein n=1 Tax=Brachybacterium sp. TaxID=1891286 RepID=UPI002ED3A677